jgi:hypothetical protein
MIGSPICVPLSGNLSIAAQLGTPRLSSSPAGQNGNLFRTQSHFSTDPCVIAEHPTAGTISTPKETVPATNDARDIARTPRSQHRQYAQESRRGNQNLVAKGGGWVHARRLPGGNQACGQAGGDHQQSSGAQHQPVAMVRARDQSSQKSPDRGRDS